MHQHQYCHQHKHDTNDNSIIATDDTTTAVTATHEGLSHDGVGLVGIAGDHVRRPHEGRGVGEHDGHRHGFAQHAEPTSQRHLREEKKKKKRKILQEDAKRTSQKSKSDERHTQKRKENKKRKQVAQST